MNKGEQSEYYIIVKESVAVSSCFYFNICLSKGIVVCKASLRFEIRLNFSINPRKLSILYWYFSNRSEASKGNMDWSVRIGLKPSYHITHTGHNDCVIRNKRLSEIVVRKQP